MFMGVWFEHDAIALGLLLLGLAAVELLAFTL